MSQAADPSESPIRYPDFIERNKTLLRRIALGMSVTSVVLVMLAAFVIIRQERAFDEQTCPFAAGPSRFIDELIVIEESRTCTEGVAEHRWMLERPSEAPLELGRRRLAVEQFDAARYRWRVFVEEGRVRVHVEVDGAAPVTYREEVAKTGRVSLPSRR